MPTSSFEAQYFQSVYGGKYILRNPAYKWRSFLKEILVYKREGDLLDVGCGFGLFLKQSTSYFRSSGCDVSAYALEQARKTLPKVVDLFQAPLGSLPVQTTYDVVTCFDVLEHVQDLDKAWLNLAGLLKSNGILALTVPVYDGPLGRLVDRLDHDDSHIHRQGRNFWLKQVESLFITMAFKGIWRYFLFDRFYINFVSSRSRSITTAILLIVKKRDRSV